MFESYQQVLNPRSILDVVDKDVIQSMMQGFFYKQRAGLTLLYDVEPRPPSSSRFERLEPFDDIKLVRTSNFNSFCALFRQESRRNALCEECDTKRAELVMQSREAVPARYTCHMGLTDFSFPIKLGKRVRGVLLAGQLIPSGDAICRERIQKAVRLKAGELGTELMKLVDEAALASQITATAEEQLLAFCTTFQKAVNALYTVEQDRAMQEALVTANEHLAASPPSGEEEDWIVPVERVLQGIQELLGGVPVALLARRRSRYVVSAASKALAITKGRTVPVLNLISLLNTEWKPLALNSDLARKLLGQVEPDATSGALLRLDSPGPAELGLSAVFFFGAEVPQEHRKFLEACCGVVVSRADTARLLSELRKQQADFVSQVAFSGHFLKTPIQSALFAVRRIGRLVGSDAETETERERLIKRTEQQILMALFDAAVLQTATTDLRSEFDVYTLIDDLRATFEHIGATRGIILELQTRPAFGCSMRAVASQIRVALSNLLDNAVKYSYHGKKVRVRLSQPAEGHILIEIENYGEGFTPDARDRLFHIGVRGTAEDTKVKHGLGIGLAQAKEIIESWGGSIDIESNPVGFDSTSDTAPHLTAIRVILPVTV